MELPGWLQVGTAVAAVWGAVLSTVALYLRVRDRRGQRTTLVVKPVFEFRSSEGKTLERVGLTLVNTSVPVRAVHPSRVVATLRQRNRPWRVRRVEWGRPQPKYVNGLQHVPAGAAAEFSLPPNELIACLQQVPPERLAVRFIVVDETRNSHSSDVLHFKPGDILGKMRQLAN